MEIVFLLFFFCLQPATASSVLLVHLGAVGALASGVALCGGEGTCACGALLHALHPLQLWTVCGLHADRAAAIAAPLHYAAIVSAKKVYDKSCSVSLNRFFFLSYYFILFLFHKKI